MTTPYPGHPVPAPRRPLRWIAIACFAVGLVVTGVFGWRLVETMPRQPVGIGDGPVELEREGLTVYSSRPVLPPECEATDADGGDIAMKRPGGSETITLGGQTWYVVSRSVEPVPPQAVVVSCADDETNATYAVGPRASVVGFVLSIFGAIGSFLLFVILGAILLGIDVTKRRRANHPPGNTFPGPPTANTFPTYQPPGPPPQYPNPRPTDQG